MTKRIPRTGTGSHTVRMTVQVDFELPGNVHSRIEGNAYKARLEAFLQENPWILDRLITKATGAPRTTKLEPEQVKIAFGAPRQAW